MTPLDRNQHERLTPVGTRLCRFWYLLELIAVFWPPRSRFAPKHCLLQVGPSYRTARRADRPTLPKALREAFAGAA
jgi:hypothetical protein